MSFDYCESPDLNRSISKEAALTKSSLDLGLDTERVAIENNE